jgi:hypothetical protein
MKISRSGGYLCCTIIDRMIWLIILTASTLTVDPTASITKFLPATTLHVIATLSFLYPELAEGALLVLGTFDELLEFGLVEIRVLTCLILITFLAFVKWNAAIQTESVATHIASEIWAVNFSIINKSVLAISLGAP